MCSQRHAWLYNAPSGGGGATLMLLPCEHNTARLKCGVNPTFFEGLWPLLLLVVQLVPGDHSVAMPPSHACPPQHPTGDIHADLDERDVLHRGRWWHLIARKQITAVDLPLADVFQLPGSRGAAAHDARLAHTPGLPT